MVRLSTRPKQKQTIKKMELIKTIRARVGTVRSRIFRTPRAFSGKSRVLPTTQSAAAARRCGRFGEPCFCCAKMVRLSITHQTKTDHQKDGLFLFGGRGWIRTTEAEKQQIYSLPPLATRELAHNGAGDGTRTRNLLITNQLLCQLSYTSVKNWCLRTESNCRHRDFQSLALPTELPRQMATWKGLEPSTSSVTG